MNRVTPILRQLIWSTCICSEDKRWHSCFDYFHLFQTFLSVSVLQNTIYWYNNGK